MAWRDLKTNMQIEDKIKAILGEGFNETPDDTIKNIVSRLATVESGRGGRNDIVSFSRNTNGYIKFYNSFQIVWGRFTTGSPSSPVGGTNFRYSSASITFPLAFNSSCAFIIGVQDHHGSVEGASTFNRGIGRTGGTLWMWDLKGNLQCRYLAVGY